MRAALAALVIAIPIPAGAACISTENEPVSLPRDHLPGGRVLSSRLLRGREAC